MFWIFSNSRCVLPVCLLALGLQPSGVRAEDARPESRQIEFPSSTAETSGNNLFNQPPIGDGGSKSPIVDPFQSPKPVFKTPSLGGVLPKPLPTAPQPTSQSKKLQELIEKQKNWIFADPDEMAAGTTPEEIFHLKGFNAKGEPEETLSPIEKFLRRELESKQRAIDKAKKNAEENNDVSPNLYGVKRNPDSLSEAINERIFGSTPGDAEAFPSATRYDFATHTFQFNGYGYKPATANPAQKARMEEFKKIIGMTPDKSPVNPWGTGTSPNPTAGGDLNPFANPFGVNPPKKSTASGLFDNPNTSSTSPTTGTKPAAASAEEKGQQLFQPVFTIPRRRVQ